VGRPPDYSKLYVGIIILTEVKVEPLESLNRGSDGSWGKPTINELFSLIVLNRLQPISF